MIENVENGDKAKDIVSGFEGIVLGITDWLYGCRTIGIKPQQLDKDGKPIDLIWFDEKQVEIIEKRNIGTSVDMDDISCEAVTEIKDPGGPRPIPTRDLGPKK